MNVDVLFIKELNGGSHTRGGGVGGQYRRYQNDPYLFNFVLDELLERLIAAGVGIRLGNED